MRWFRTRCVNARLLVTLIPRYQWLLESALDWKALSREGTVRGVSSSGWSMGPEQYVLRQISGS